MMDNSTVVGQIRNQGNPLIDLFVTHLNTKLPLFISPVTDETAAGIDGLSQPWDGIHGLAYPPTPLLPLVLKKLEQSRDTTLTLIAPNWPSQLWYPPLLDLLVQSPRSLGAATMLLKQGNTIHARLEVFNLQAWKLSSTGTKRRAFQRTLPAECPEQYGNQPGECTNLNGNYSWIGVISGVSIHTLSLYRKLLIS